MPWITHTPDREHDTSFEVLQIYNMLDCSVTAELRDTLEAKMSSNHWLVYERAKRVEALCLAMSAAAMPVDTVELASAKEHLSSQKARLLEIWNRYVEAVEFPGIINPQSPHQLKRLFYDHLNIPVQTKYDPKKREHVVSLDRKILEDKLSNYPLAAPFIQILLGIRATGKMLSVLYTGLEPDNTLRCSFNPAGTETGRMSSNENVFGRGFNAQNVTPRLRRIVTARERRRIGAADLEQAESRAVAYLSQDENYIRACEGGDLHTTVTKMVWRNLPWTGDAKADRAIAEQVFVRVYSYRDMSKRGGHGTNYYGKAPTIAKNMEVERALVERFQEDYFNAFPGIRAWQMDTIHRIQRDRCLITPMGRERNFWGRPDDAATHRKGIAFVPQSLVGDIMNEALVALGLWLRREKIDCNIIAQVHDAGVFDYREEDEEWLIPEINKRLIYPVEVHGRELRIPVELKVGWNWGPKEDANPYGLVKWKPGFKETRERKTARERLLDHRF